MPPSRRVITVFGPDDTIVERRMKNKRMKHTRTRSKSHARIRGNGAALHGRPTTESDRRWSTRVAVLAIRVKMYNRRIACRVDVSFDSVVRRQTNANEFFEFQKRLKRRLRFVSYSFGGSSNRFLSYTRVVDFLARQSISPVKPFPI